MTERRRYPNGHRRTSSGVRPDGSLADVDCTCGATYRWGWGFSRYGVPENANPNRDNGWYCPAAENAMGL